MSYNFYNQQNTAPYNFPQPNGNVYSINNSLEVANVPTGAGISVALCMPENLMYIKTVQNGSPLFWSYKIIPYTKEKETVPADQIKIETISIELEKRINEIEEKVNFLVKELGGSENVHTK